ncbi:MAG: iron ABC transporter permease [Clostridiaceae bacterium]
MKKHEGFRIFEYAIFLAVMLGTAVLCVCAGSVSIPVKDTLAAIRSAVSHLPMPEGVAASIILSVRLPRVLAVALTGASLSLCGAAMQGLLRNPLADGSTLGVSSGASLGAVLAIALGLAIPGIPLAGTMVMAMLFAFLSLLLILFLAYKLDPALSTNTIILVGIVFSMFCNSLVSLFTVFAADRVRSILFWMMGSLSGSDYTDVLVLGGALTVCGTAIVRFSRELNAFSVGEDNARHVGVNVKRVRLLVLVFVSVLIGVCVAIGGTIGFVGLVMPHMTRLIVGPNHRRLLPSVLFFGATFLMLADLVGRVILNPLELPIGVVTSLIGAAAFILIFFRSRAKGGELRA